MGHLRQVLEDHGIRCLIKNEYLAGGLGELPFNECWPELWVLDEADHRYAGEIAAGILESREPGREPWRCPDCGEELEGQFTDCWRCGDPGPEHLLA